MPSPSHLPLLSSQAECCSSPRTHLQTCPRGSAATTLLRLFSLSPLIADKSQGHFSIALNFLLLEALLFSGTPPPPSSLHSPLKAPLAPNMEVLPGFHTQPTSLFMPIIFSGYSAPSQISAALDPLLTSKPHIPS